jgi:hypothetical protein
MSSIASAQTANAPAPAIPDLTKQPTLFVVGYAHLDTQWRWTYPQTIREYLANTLHDNFALPRVRLFFRGNVTLVSSSSDKESSVPV